MGLYSNIVMSYTVVVLVMTFINIPVYWDVRKYKAKQKQPGCKKSVRPIRSHNGYKRSKTLISSKAKKLNILLRVLLLE